MRCTPSRHRPGSASCAPAPPSPRPRSHCRTEARSAVFIRSFTHSLDGGSLTLPSLLPCMESNAVSKLINIFNRMLMRRKTKPIFSDMKIDNSMEGIFATKLAQVKIFWITRQGPQNSSFQFTVSIIHDVNFIRIKTR